mmetsp:Transcript_40127/g.96920  ORF Transcript_40127/g.96920 Transcript_40127/m.96920 type:complete len:215 (-) Transcript_40127:162-806(-)
MVYWLLSLVLWSAGTSMLVTSPLTHSAPYSMARSRRYLSMISRRHIPMYSFGCKVSPIETSAPVGETRFMRRTLRSTTVSGMSNSPTIQRGMAPPHGLALSIFRSNMTVSMPFSWAKISAAHAPEGPPPTTATLYRMSRFDPLFVDVTPKLLDADCVNDDGVNADATPANDVMAKMENFMVCFFVLVLFSLMCFVWVEVEGVSVKKTLKNCVLV